MYASEPVDRLLEFMREKIRRQGVPLPQTDYPNYWQRNRRLCGRVGWQPPIKNIPRGFSGGYFILLLFEAGSCIAVNGSKNT